MTQDEIIEITKQAGGFSPTPEFLEAFAKLVEDKTIRELREEIVYKWVPPSFVEFAVKAEREEIAKFIENDYVRQFYQPWRKDLVEAIRAKGEA